MFEFDECGHNNKKFNKLKNYCHQEPLDSFKKQCACQIFYNGRYIDLVKGNNFESTKCHVMGVGSLDQGQLDNIEEFIKYVGLEKVKQ